jgi:hypothetical protein
MGLGGRKRYYALQPVVWKWFYITQSSFQTIFPTCVNHGSHISGHWAWSLIHRASSLDHLHILDCASPVNTKTSRAGGQWIE